MQARISNIILSKTEYCFTSHDQMAHYSTIFLKINPYSESSNRIASVLTLFRCDFLMCNPPFYGSKQEVTLAAEDKEFDPNAVCCHRFTSNPRPYIKYIRFAQEQTWR